MTAQLQEGIYHAKGMRPASHFGVLFLRASNDVDASQVGQAFGTLWEVYQGLKRGDVGNLPGHPLPHGNLTVLVGYGPNTFKLKRAQRVRPRELADDRLFRSPRAGGGGPVLAGAGIHYGDDVATNLATEEILVQFIADTQLAVNRAIVETWRALEELTDPRSEVPPLQVTTFYTGFQRDDGRSWLDFHDGLSNMRSEERLGAIAIKPNEEDAWTQGGTYAAFLRIGVDLMSWWKLDSTQQETLVGRKKLTGCGIEALDAEGLCLAEEGCPVLGTREVTDPGNTGFREHPTISHAQLLQSHVQRAMRPGAPEQPGSLRIFRQGYEFLEPVAVAPGFRAGLNFVSFQDTTERLLRILVQRGWLGRTNFGGDPDEPLPGMASLLSVRAGGIFLVPPVVEGETFPGAQIFNPLPGVRELRPGRTKHRRRRQKDAAGIART